MNTKQDYLNLINTPEGRKGLQDLLDLRYIWKDVKIVKNKEDGVEDDTHRLIPEEDWYIQQEWVEDNNAPLFKLGFTVDEVKELLGV